MEIGLLIRDGKLVPGREAQAIELFGEATRYFTGKVSEKVVTYFEPFFLMTSDLEEETGFFVLKGPAPEIFKLMEDEKYRWLMQKAMVLVEHLRSDLLTVGEGIPEQSSARARCAWNSGSSCGPRHWNRAGEAPGDSLPSSEPTDIPPIAADGAPRGAPR